ncbi:uncharacterized protein [Lepeophtheirus salmonis]|uniref:uncharacterized protein n=1 Tax=Lepeophtheirus salmonis TaxID=72036 RepID=UPI001AE230BB|nr:uncharacterized protein LOC121120994 [Lepeophtheirus salmonis]
MLSFSMTLNMNIISALIIIFLLNFANANNKSLTVMYHEETIAAFEKANNELAHCRLYRVNHRDDPNKDKILAKLKPKAISILEVNMQVILQTIIKCSSIHEERKESFTAQSKSELSLWLGVISGTKWCGFKDIATDYEDLGSYERVDRCCRGYHYCPIKISSNHKKYGIINSYGRKIAHCDCDKMFFNCLKNIIKTSKNKSLKYKTEVVGILKFNVIEQKCLKDENNMQDGNERCAEIIEGVEVIDEEYLQYDEEYLKCLNFNVKKKYFVSNGYQKF